MVCWSVSCFTLIVALFFISAVSGHVDETAKTNFHIIDSKSNDIPDALVIIEDSTGNKIGKISNAEGKISVQVSPGRANITVKAGGYEDFNDNSEIISENASYTYVLNRTISSKATLLNLILLIIPFIISLLFLYLSDWPDKPEYNLWYAYLPALGWVFSFILLIRSAYFYNDYNIYFLDPMLKVSLFVPIAAFLGATSYITVSVLKNIERNPPPLTWKLIYVAYGRRLLMAPYIAVIALFTITELAQVKNLWSILFFAYFVGLYTKEIEGTLEEIGKKFLTEKQKNELKGREIEASEIVKRLGISIGVADKLIKLDLKNISDMLAITNIAETAKKAEIEPEYLKKLISKANTQYIDIDLMKTKLGMGQDKVYRLVDAGIYSIIELSQIEGKCLSEFAVNSGISEECLKNLVKLAKDIGR